MKEIEVSLVVIKKKKVVPKLNFAMSGDESCSSKNDENYKIAMGIDFTFNTIKNVKKVNWKDDAPWFREITDGFCWLCYC
jgi:hypothetical protein